jgi:hypothetical protein
MYIKKKLMIAALMLQGLAGSAFAGELTIKECEASLMMPEGSQVDMLIQFNMNENVLTSVVTQSTRGQTQTKKWTAQFFENKVREGLKPNANPAALNEVERFIVHAMMVASDPILGSDFSAGIDLEAVRSAKVYIAGERARMGSLAVVEAKDSEGRLLGSFVGGLLVAPCR